MLGLETYFKDRKGLTRFYRYYMTPGLAQLGLLQLSELINSKDLQILHFPKILSKTIFSDNQASWMLLDSFEGEFTLDNRINMR